MSAVFGTGIWDTEVSKRYYYVNLFNIIFKFL